jgi:hypothetical protein
METNTTDVVHTKYALNKEEFFFETDFLKGALRGNGLFTVSVGGVFGIFTKYQSCEKVSALSERVLDNFLVRPTFT